MKHQETALERMSKREYYGLFMEQGTGKTWCLLADAERLYKSGEIQAVLVITPNNVHVNWVRREIPQHLEVDHMARAWRSGGSKQHMAAIEELFTVKKPRLRILSMNIEALLSKSGMETATRFILTYKTLIIIDESQRIKNPAAARTNRVMQLRMNCKYARISTGTPATNAPVDVFSQMEFLKPGLLGTSSYRAFVATYAEVLSRDHPMMVNMMKKNPRIAHAQIIARDSEGRPKWRNLQRLQKLLEPHTFRITKEDCLDLPPKVYKQHYFQLSAAQQKAYEFMGEECRMMIGDEPVPVQTLGAGIKLQQITSGFVLHEGFPHYVVGENTRLEAFMDLAADLEGQFIVWARFREEIRAIAEALAAAGIPAATYFGDTSREDREAAVEDFQSGKIRAFVANQETGGTGLTLTAAQTSIYYSNDFNLEHRLQSEDRSHRKGTKGTVVYIDLIAENSIDETIVGALRSKSNMAAAIVGDINNKNKL